MKKIHLLKYSIAIVAVITVPLAQAMTLDEVFGEIDNKATEFIATYNQEHHTNLHTLEANRKFYASNCLLPLKVKWHKLHLGLKNLPHKYVLSISCQKSIDSDHRKWDVYVDVRNEQGNSIQSID
ncbi:hypothetical protein DKK70_07570 [Gilliamella apicola]|uniref:Uncharacterized protein n=1 Tax=Gilliamella apicola TaxID=1196095 RepID=A0A2V4E389_9GAMM|nr:hypothetical protein [Gilliamella apicola]PXZ07692.1 hypothetical protein DKK70_07570 [Gilliamella apicola]